MNKGLTTGILLAISQILFQPILHAQLTTAADGGNKKATAAERVGITDITIHYDRPHVKGREGKIWGMLVPVGYTDQGFGTSKAAPWRAGANENTTIEFSTPVKIEGQELPAGKYGFFIAYDPDACTLIFSKNSASWGSFYYDPNADVLRVKVKPQPLDRSVEWLKYEFQDEQDNAVTVALEWEKLMIPFHVEVDYLNTQLASFRQELTSDKGFTWNAWDQAAQFCIQHNTNLEEALGWANTAISGTFIGQKNFQTLSTKAQVLELMGKKDEADAIMKEALPLGQTQEVHNYAKHLLGEKKTKEAFDAFKLNYDRHPGEFITLMGMARGYSGLGEYKKALEYLKKAEPLAMDAPNKVNIARLTSLLESGKDINQ